MSRLTTPVGVRTVGKKRSDDAAGSQPAGAPSASQTGRQINFRAPGDLCDRLDRVADTLALDTSSLIRMILAEHLAGYERRAEQVRRERESKE